MIKIVPFEPEHLDLFDKKIEDEWLWANIDIKELCGKFAERGAMFSAFNVYGKVVAIAGIMAMWRGVGEVWATFAPDGERHMKTIHRKSKEVIKTALDNGFWRLQTTVKAGFDKGIRWVEGLGFHFEGKMERYAPDGSDMLRYAIVRRDDHVA